MRWQWLSVASWLASTRHGCVTGSRKKFLCGSCNTTLNLVNYYVLLNNIDINIDSKSLKINVVLSSWKWAGRPWYFKCHLTDVRIRHLGEDLTQNDVHQMQQASNYKPEIAISSVKVIVTFLTKHFYYIKREEEVGDRMWFTEDNVWRVIFPEKMRFHPIT